jgi:hypothetical protein
MGNKNNATLDDDFKQIAGKGNGEKNRTINNLQRIIFGKNKNTLDARYKKITLFQKSPAHTQDFSI